MKRRTLFKGTGAVLLAWLAAPFVGAVSSKTITEISLTEITYTPVPYPCWLRGVTEFKHVKYDDVYAIMTIDGERTPIEEHPKFSHFSPDGDPVLTGAIDDYRGDWFYNPDHEGDTA